MPTNDFLVTCVVEVNDQPLCFLEINPSLHVDYISGTVDAEGGIRAKFRALYNVTPTPGLHGVSAMEQRLAFYYMDKATSQANPNYVVTSNDYMIDTVPAGRWDMDLTIEGYQMLVVIINDFKQMATAL